jgi:diguanylate cyclase (GGDEF)-like protein
VLRALAALLLESVREDDIACRLGGEEFVVVLPGMDREGAQERAEAMRLAIQRMRVTVGSGTLRLTASLGVAVFPEHGESEADLLRAADAAVYGAKAAGRNCVALPPAKG